VNLDFEVANVSDLPSGQGDWVSVASGMPGWSVYLGGAQTNQIMHNNYYLALAGVSILGPNFNDGFSHIQGRYTAHSAAGGSRTDTQVFVPAGIGQVGTIPSDARVVQFTMLAREPDYISLTFRGQAVPLSMVELGGGYRQCLGDVSAFADQSGELRLSALPAPSYPYNWAYLDDIKFLVPEPSATALVALGAVLLALRRRKATPS